MNNEQFESLQLKSFIEINGTKYLVNSRLTKNAFELHGKNGKRALLRREMLGNGFRIEFRYAPAYNQRRWTTSRRISTFNQL